MCMAMQTELFDSKQELSTESCNFDLLLPYYNFFCKTIPYLNSYLPKIVFVQFLFSGVAKLSTCAFKLMRWQRISNNSVHRDEVV